MVPKDRNKVEHGHDVPPEGWLSWKEVEARYRSKEFADREGGMLVSLVGFCEDLVYCVKGNHWQKERKELPDADARTIVYDHLIRMGEPGKDYISPNAIAMMEREGKIEKIPTENVATQWANADLKTTKIAGTGQNRGGDGSGMSPARR
jgi:hypothetical protein